MLIDMGTGWVMNRGLVNVWVVKLRRMTVLRFIDMKLVFPLKYYRRLVADSMPFAMFSCVLLCGRLMKRLTSSVLLFPCGCTKMLYSDRLRQLSRLDLRVRCVHL